MSSFSKSPLFGLISILSAVAVLSFLYLTQFGFGAVLAGLALGASSVGAGYFFVANMLFRR